MPSDEFWNRWDAVQKALLRSGMCIAYNVAQEMRDVRASFDLDPKRVGLAGRLLAETVATALHPGGRMDLHARLHAISRRRKRNASRDPVRPPPRQCLDALRRNGNKLLHPLSHCSNESDDVDEQPHFKHRREHVVLFGWNVYPHSSPALYHQLLKWGFDVERDKHCRAHLGTAPSVSALQRPIARDALAVAEWLLEEIDPDTRESPPKNEIFGIEKSLWRRILFGCLAAMALIALVFMIYLRWSPQWFAWWSDEADKPIEIDAVIDEIEGCLTKLRTIKSTAELLLDDKVDELCSSLRLFDFVAEPTEDWGGHALFFGTIGLLMGVFYTAIIVAVTMDTCW